MLLCSPTCVLDMSCDALPPHGASRTGRICMRAHAEAHEQTGRLDAQSFPESRTCEHVQAVFECILYTAINFSLT